MTVLEAGLVLTLSQIPFLLLAIKYTMETPDTMFTIGTVIDVITNSVRPGEVLIYIAAILASATVYYIMRPRLLPNLPKTFLVCTLGPIFLLLMATPNFMADRYEKAANVAFMSDYAIFLLSTAFLLWLYLIFIQRRIVSTIDFSMTGKVNAVIDEIESGERDG